MLYFFAKGRVMRMKKVIVFFTLVLATSMSLSAWEHSAGLEIGSPYFSINSRGDGVKKVTQPQLTARYFGKASNGFCVSATLSPGLAFSKDFTLQGESATAKGFGMELTMGAGYAFDITDRFALAALGSMSLDWTRFKYKKNIYAGTSYGTVTAEWTQSDNALFVGLGAELLASFKLTDHISIVGSFAMRFVDGGKLWKKGSAMGKNYNSSFDLRGNFSVAPSLGARWIF